MCWKKCKKSAASWRAWMCFLRFAALVIIFQMIATFSATCYAKDAGAEAIQSSIAQHCDLINVLPYKNKSQAAAHSASPSSARVLIIQNDPKSAHGCRALLLPISAGATVTIRAKQGHGVLLNYSDASRHLHCPGKTCSKNLKHGKTIHKKD